MATAAPSCSRLASGPPASGVVTGGSTMLNANSSSALIASRSAWIAHSQRHNRSDRRSRCLLRTATSPWTAPSTVLQFNVSRIAMSNGPLHRANRPSGCKCRNWTTSASSWLRFNFRQERRKWARRQHSSLPPSRGSYGSRDNSCGDCNFGCCIDAVDLKYRFRDFETDYPIVFHGSLRVAWCHLGRPDRRRLRRSTQR